MGDGDLRGVSRQEGHAITLFGLAPKRVYAKKEGVTYLQARRKKERCGENDKAF